MVAVGVAVEAPGPGVEVVVVVGEAVEQGLGQAGHVARGRALARVGQAGGVAEGGRGHAEAARLCGHHLGEAALGAADGLRHRGGDVVRRFGHQRIDRLLDRQARPRRQPQARGRLSRRMAGDPDALAQGQRAAVQLPKDHVQGHHLGQGGRITGRVGVVLVEHLTADGIDHKTGIAGIGLGTARRRQRHHERCRNRHRQKAQGSDGQHRRLLSIRRTVV